MGVITRKAKAKINLALAVGAARESDGMHPIASWMVQIGLADTLTIQRLDDGQVSRFEIVNDPQAIRPKPIDWPLEHDLAVRAVRTLEAEIGLSLPVALRLEKRIPVGAGLGGGSSDAAAALLAVRDLFSLAITDERLGAIAIELGSDVPYFLGEGPALVTGFGEQVERTPSVTDPGYVVLFVPSFGCATGKVYEAFDSLGSGVFHGKHVATCARSGAVGDACCFNDLAAAAELAEPTLIELRARIEAAASVRAHITGSGSAMFVPCETAGEGERIVEAARRYVGPIASAVTRII